MGADRLLERNHFGGSLARELSCSNIKQCVGAKATVDPTGNRKTMSVETIVYVFCTLENTFVFNFSA